MEIPQRYAWYQRRDQAWLASLPDVVESYLDAAKMVAEVLEASAKVSTEEGQLLHWDLHFDNVLAGDREPWTTATTMTSRSGSTS